MRWTRSTYQSLSLWLLRLYPRRWRGRYEVEVQALLEEHEIRLRTIVDLLFGAVDARLDPAYARERLVLTMRTSRFTTVTLFGAFALFGITLLPLVGTLLDPEVEQNVPKHYGALVAAYPLVSTASSAILAISFLADVALLTTFFVLALGRISNGRGSIAIALLVVAAVAALVVFAPELPQTSMIILPQILLALLGIVVSIGGIGAALAQSQLRLTQWRALLVAAATATLAMALITIGAVNWLMTVLLHANLIYFSYGMSFYIGVVSALGLAGRRRAGRQSRVCDSMGAEPSTGSVLGTVVKVAVFGNSRAALGVSIDASDADGSPGFSPKSTDGRSSVRGSGRLLRTSPTHRPSGRSVAA